MKSIRLKAVDFSADGFREKTTLEQNNDVAGIGKELNALSTPLTALTTGAVNGSGAFDKLMAAAKLHLTEEFNAGRITGAEYSQVYLGTMSTVLQTSIQFLLNEQQAQVFNAQIGKIRQETVTELTNTCDSIPTGLGFNFIPDEATAIPPVTT